MSAASFQILAVLAAKATLRDGQYGSCVHHSSAHTLKGEEECVVFSLLYLVYVAFTLRCTGGVRAKAGVLSRWRSLDLMCCRGKKDSFAKCFHKIQS